jgi:hypothetical protein
MSEVEGDKPSFNSIIDNASNLISLKLKKHIYQIFSIACMKKRVYIMLMI